MSRVRPPFPAPNELTPVGAARLPQLSRTSEPDHGKRIPRITKKASEKEADEALVKASVRPLREDFPQEVSPQAERGETVRDVDRVRPPERPDGGATAAKRRELVMLEDHLRDVGRPTRICRSPPHRPLRDGSRVAGSPTSHPSRFRGREMRPRWRSSDSFLVARRRARQRQSQAEVGDSIRRFREPSKSAPTAPA
jgi:hypothetical protein